MQNYIRNKKSLLFLGILLLTLGGLFYFNYNKKQKGFLQIDSLDETLTVYIDNIKKDSITDINPKFQTEKGIHNVIVYKEGYWPWTKEATVISGGTLILKPFFIPQNTEGFIIKKADSEYWGILAMFRKNLLRKEALKAVHSIEIKDQITAIDFYKDRNDVILMSLANGVYALGVDYKTEQNLQPIYTGENPTFVKKDNNSIYILDNNILMEVTY